MVPAIYSVATVTVCVVSLLAFRSCSLGLRLQLTTLTQLLSTLLCMVDADQNGAIDIHELKQVDRSMPAYVLESEFQRIDVNRDGKITIEEFDEDAGRSMKKKLR